MTDLPASVTEVSLRNYKSIASCDLEIGSLAILIGPNGSGKSNFLDALRFVSDALSRSLGAAVHDRGGFQQMCYHGATEASVTITLRFGVKAGEGQYVISLRGHDHGYVVALEACLIGSQESSFSVAEGVLKAGPRPGSVVEPTELYLPRVGGTEPFSQLYGLLSGMSFFNPNVDRIREYQSVDDGRRLKRDGSNLASVLSRLHASAPDWRDAVDGYLHAMAPQIVGVETPNFGSKIALQFLQRLQDDDGVDGKPGLREFYAESMSDGTLRGLGVLVALLQGAAGDGPASLIGVEEPESGLHIGALGALKEAIIEASESIQTLVATHSVELLDNDELLYDCIFPVELSEGESRIGPLDESSVAAIERGDFTVGELLSMGQASPRFSPRRRDE